MNDCDKKVIVFIEKHDDKSRAFFQKGDEILLCSPIKPNKIDALRAAILLMEYPGYVDALFP